MIIRAQPTVQASILEVLGTCCDLRDCCIYKSHSFLQAVPSILPLPREPDKQNVRQALPVAQNIQATYLSLSSLCLNWLSSTNYLLNNKQKPIPLNMAKSKLDSMAYTKHFKPGQKAELAPTIWQYLLDEIGSAKAIYEMKPKSFKTHAKSFLYSDEGMSFWPWSGMGQWQYDVDEAETIAFVADLMTQQRKKHTEESPAFMIDYDPPAKTTPVKAPPTPKTPSSTKFGSVQSKLKVSSKKATPSMASATRKVDRASTSFSQDSYHPDRKEAPTSSPTIAADIPYSAESIDHGPITAAAPVSSSIPPSAKRRMIPTKASHKIALGMSPAPGENDDYEMEEDTIIVEARSTAKPHTPSNIDTAGTKRTASEADRASDQGSPTPSFARPPKKRTALAPPSPIMTDPEQQLPDIDAVLNNTSPALSNRDLPINPAPLFQPPRSASFDMPPPPASRTSTVEPGDGSTIRALGHDFTPRGLAKALESNLAYVRKCKDENVRSANASTTQELRQHFQFRAKLLGELYLDLESRVKSHAAKGEDDDMEGVESSFLLWSSKGQ